MADIYNSNSNTIISGTSNDDFIQNNNLQPINSINTGENVTISGGNGDDTIQNSGCENSSINGDKCNDDIRNLGKNATISGGNGNDVIDNWSSGEYTFISGVKGNDYIVNEGSYVTISGDKGNDTILNGCREFDGRIFNVINCGKNVLFNYRVGDGKDIIYGFDSKDTLTLENITFKTSMASYNRSNGTLTFNVSGGSITLKEFATTTTFHINNDTYKISNGNFKKQ